MWLGQTPKGLDFNAPKVHKKWPPTVIYVASKWPFNADFVVLKSRKFLSLSLSLETSLFPPLTSVLSYKRKEGI